MALKFKITKTAYGKLSEEMKAEYVEEEGGKGYVLDVEGLPEPEDTGELKRAKDREKERADNLQEELTEATAKIEKLEKAQTTQDKDVARVTARYEKKLTEAKAESQEVIDGLREKIAKGVRENVASKLATTISNSPKIMERHILDRLTVEFNDDGEAVLKVLDKDNKPSDMTVEKLGEELVANKDFAAIIVGSRAKGGGAAHNPVLPTGGAQDGKPVSLASADRGTLVERVREAHAKRFPNS
jgi:hypothetical protein